jgi:hypothetical protein
MLVFLCRALGDEVRLSAEHTHHEWVPVEKAKEKISDFYYPEVDRFLKMGLGKRL